ncbi:hypothetical protein AAFF_G00240520 [Aldrovandia affinis]|uniref:TLDc domain-containing protein n=1 Tax=Aldrovandia affinis TaxID=143900 RepID=A0AAD7WTM5_9TELE|nr:hypothetical protein AAFF_G00240520 [Aldrovandia affinis]
MAVSRSEGKECQNSQDRVGQGSTLELLLMLFKIAELEMLKAFRCYFLAPVKGPSGSMGSPRNEEEEGLEIIEAGDNLTQRRNSSALNLADMLSPHVTGSEDPIQPKVTGVSNILQIDQMYQLSKHLPPSLVQCTWTLAYSVLRHGSSLGTLYRGTLGLDCYTLTVMKDTYGQVFGALCSAPLKVSLSYYGTGQTFLFSFSPQLKVFHWTRGNSYFVKGSTESLVFGGGSGHFGLLVGEDLHHGRSQRCETFDNDILSTAEDFLINDLEVWALS